MARLSFKGCGRSDEDALLNASLKLDVLLDFDPSNMDSGRKCV